MINLYGVCFKPYGKVYYYSFQKCKLKKDDKVIVSSDNGERIGTITKIISKNIENIDTEQIIRKATSKDILQEEKNKIDAEEALQKSQKLVTKYKLRMNILKAEYSLDRKKLQFNFLAEERIDFRELAKALASIYKVRIELHQIGVRDKAQEVGGIGQCGRALCCKSFLKEISSISINTVKNQNIAINPSKINGQCGRLLCCLTYENEEYTKCQKCLPKIGENVKTVYGIGKVISVDILNKTYKVDIDGTKKEIKVIQSEKCSIE